MVDGDSTVERFVNSYLGSGETEAAWMRRDLKTTALPLHDVVVADRALVLKAADAVEIVRSRAPSLFAIASSVGEAAIVVGQEAREDPVGSGQIGGADQAEFAGEAVLKGAPEAFDAAFGLRAFGGDVGDAELLQGAGRTAWVRGVRRVVLPPTSDRRCAGRWRGDRRRN